MAFASAELNDVFYYRTGDLFHHEVFAWSFREDVWGGLTDEEERRRLRDRITSDFDPLLHPSKRTLAILSNFVADLAAVAISHQSLWSDSGQSAEGNDDDFVRLNALLALYHQLSWIVQIFLDVPGASVTIR